MLYWFVAKTLLVAIPLVIVLNVVLHVMGMIEPCNAELMSGCI